MKSSRFGAVAGCAWLLLSSFSPITLWAADVVPTTATPTTATPGGSLPKITEIRFVGNKTTRPAIMLQAMNVKVGDPADPRRIAQSRQAIMDLGLFKTVTATLVPAPGGVALVVSVVEKYYFLPIPRIGHDQYYNITWGGELRWDNMAGLNQSLSIIDDAEHASTAPGNTTTLSLNYSYPQIVGTPYEVDFNISRTRTPVLTTNNGVQTGYSQEYRTGQFILSRWYEKQGPTEGWRAGVGFVWHRLGNDVGFGDPTGLAQGKAVGMSFLLEKIYVHDLTYSRVGRDYGYSGEYGSTMLGSDNNYARHLFYYREYLTVLGRPYHTLEWQLQLGLSTDNLLGSPYAYYLGGGSSLRGYVDSSIPGNSFVLANIQYLAPLFGYDKFRGAVFTDIGNAYPSNSAIDFSGLKTSVGLGLRLKLRSFVKVDLRLDVAYGIDSHLTKVYASSSEMF